ncbi:MAG: winged helix-turn-helix transcriptional regulator [Proteobacteria bacterium]|nr:winged helix-turn-helix transcriptional regulator [Pseudomonadota bacterium]
MMLLTDRDRERLPLVLDEAIRIRRSHQFYLWAQGGLQSFLPHETLICLSRWPGGGRAEVFSRLPLPAGAEEGVREGCEALCQALSLHWHAEDRQPCSIAPAADCLLLKMLGPLADGAGLLHACDQAVESRATIFVFLGLPGAAGERESYFARLLLPYLTNALANLPPSTPSRSIESDLSPRQRQVLAGIRSGLSNREIAAELGLSPQTVKNHVQQLLDKLKVSNRTEAALCSVSTRPE